MNAPVLISAESANALEATFDSARSLIKRLEDEVCGLRRRNIELESENHDLSERLDATRAELKRVIRANGDR